MHDPLPISGYVLAGGRSSRMGQDKATLELAGKPLIEHGLIKLRRICRDVAILSNNDELQGFAPVINDLHPGCGPMSGIEAALAHSPHEWCLIVPVDVPFLPTAFLGGFARMALGWSRRWGTRLALFAVDGIPQPTLLMIHKELLTHLSTALADGRYKLYPELKAAAENLEQERQVKASQERIVEQIVHRSAPARGMMMQFAWTSNSKFSARPSSPEAPVWSGTTPLQEAATGLYFANLNSPEEFAEAQKHVEVLDT